MKVKEWVDGTLILDGDIDIGIEEAFKEERYLEAFAILQAQIDWWLASVHQMLALKTGRVSEKEILKNWNLGEMISNFPFRFGDSAYFLLRNKVLSGKDYAALWEFYEFRNLVVHRLVVRSYQPINGKNVANRNDVTRSQAKEQFEEGRRLVGILKAKTAENSPFTNINPANPWAPAKKP